MIHSMTGFGAAEGPFGGGRLVVEVRSVNHRFLNPTIKLPGRMQAWEGDVREALRKRVARGHVTVMARVDRPATAAVMLDQERLAAWAGELRAAAASLGIDGALQMDSLVRLPGVLRTGDQDTDAEGEDGTREELLAVVEEAVSALLVMRAAEGRRLGTELEERLTVLEDARARIIERAPVRLVEYRDRLRANVAELLDGAAMDEQRLAQEVAMMAERLDVQEEIARLGGHIEAFRETLATTDAEPVGKRLGFLLQEMLREANTTGSKANDSSLLRDVLVLKEELERIREQVENVE